MHALSCNEEGEGVFVFNPQPASCVRISPTSFLIRCFLGDDDFVLVVADAVIPRGDAVLHPRARALGSAARVEIIMVLDLIFCVARYVLKLLLADSPKARQPIRMRLICGSAEPQCH